MTTLADVHAKFATHLAGFEKVLEDKTDRNVLRQLTVVITDDGTIHALVNLDGQSFGLRAFTAEDIFRDNEEPGAVATYLDFEEAARAMRNWNAKDEVQADSKHRVRAQNALEVVELQAAWLREQVEMMAKVAK